MLFLQLRQDDMCHKAIICDGLRIYKFKLQIPHHLLPIITKGSLIPPYPILVCGPPCLWKQFTPSSDFSIRMALNLTRFFPGDSNKADMLAF